MLALNLPTPKRLPILSAGDSSETPFLTDVEEVNAGPTAERPTTLLRVPLKKRSARLSLSTNAQLVLIRKKTRRWHAALAGAIAGGLAILWEKRGRRGVIAQQLFVRGLQGSYNAYTTKRNIRVPHGDVLVFCLACGQILYGFLLRPDTLPRSYTTWIGEAAKVPKECVKMNLSLVRQGTFVPGDLDKITALPDPGNVLVRAGLGSIRSSAFLGVFVVIYQSFLHLHLDLISSDLFPTLSAISCYKYKPTQVLDPPSTKSTNPLAGLPIPLVEALISKASFWVPEFMAGLALFVEEKRRRGELAMYVLPKGLESVWVMSRGKGWVFRMGNWGESALTALRMAMDMIGSKYFYPSL
ncbi:hypothetical protein C0995_012802 [Termitomyces sp. Mi166|nr:hypothetical protein C0995_012802 [Termitomyces sp. Mi166\